VGYWLPAALIGTPVRAEHAYKTSSTGMSSSAARNFAAFEQPDIFVNEIRQCFRNQR
jgi:hypothetical protein